MQCYTPFAFAIFFLPQREMLQVQIFSTDFTQKNIALTGFDCCQKLILATANHKESCIYKIW